MSNEVFTLPVFLADAENSLKQSEFHDQVTHAFGFTSDSIKKGTRFFSQSQIIAVSKQDNSEVTITTAWVISNF